MDFSVSVSCFHDELASTVERALKAAVDTVLWEITKTVGGRFAEKEKENEKLKLRLEMSERELRAVRECMKTLQDVIAQSSAGASNDRPPQDCQLHTPNDSLAFRLPGTEKGFVTEEDRASAQITPKSRQRDCNPSTARSGPANRDDVNPRFLPVEAFEHIEDAWAPEWGEGVNGAEQKPLYPEKDKEDVSEGGGACVKEEEPESLDGSYQEQELFVCSDCGKPFRALSSLKKHLLIHSGEKAHRCAQCGKTFRLAETLKKHVRTHTGEKPYPCLHCGKSFGLVGTLRDHQRIHTGEKPYSCAHCGKSFGRLGSLKNHQRIHTGEKPYACTDCDRSFKYLSSLRHHQQLHLAAATLHYSQESGAGCESDPPQLSDPGRLHAMKEEDLEDAAASISEIGLVQIVDGEEEARQLEWVAEEEEEGYRFQDGPSLRDGGGPGGAGGHRCVDCGKHLSSARTLRSHRQIHTGEKPHACPTCGKTFRRSDKLRQHQRVHSGEKPYRCPTCGRRFSQSNGLKIHQSTHPGPYPCPACGEHFDRWEDFKTHSHGGGRGSGIGAQRHACGDCGKSFRQARDLQAHRTLHTGASPHRCPECGKCFGQARTLAVHQRIHTGEKPYRCTLCGKSFRHLSGHLQHLRTHRTPEAV
ncbi:zinc finger protein 345-like [Acipenser ruthenus]|uniref:zinc finger protein 345-like n=1 Tax=Acipenser ruthenus TaxID=7906 RepID=UPI0027428AEE|nr:zinc finger protein 345-like [Acipenser ruthenus]